MAPMAYGLPVIFGLKYQKFEEANAMIIKDELPYFSIAINTISHFPLPFPNNKEKQKLYSTDWFSIVTTIVL